MQLWIHLVSVKEQSVAFHLPIFGMSDIFMFFDAFAVVYNPLLFYKSHFVTHACFKRVILPHAFVLQELFCHLPFYFVTRVCFTRVIMSSTLLFYKSYFVIYPSTLLPAFVLQELYVIHSFVLQQLCCHPLCFTKVTLSSAHVLQGFHWHLVLFNKNYFVMWPWFTNVPRYRWPILPNFQIYLWDEW